MKKLYFLIVVLIFSHISLSSQPCLPDTIIFTTQAQIDSFQILHPNCTEIEGNVEIHGNSITNLNGLNVVTSIGGYLRIWFNGYLTSLTGLEGLTFIGGDFYIAYNSYLTSLTGLDNVTFIGGSLHINANFILTSLTGLDNLTSIGGDLSIDSNYGLISLTSLDNVTSIVGDLTINRNKVLTSLTGLDNVTSIGGNLWMFYNLALTSLTGLDNVTSIGGSMMIGPSGMSGGGGGNPVLTSLTGLEGLISIGGNLKIVYNATLSSLTGLDNVTSIGGDLFIYYNNYLSSCEAQGLCDYLSNPNGSVNIYNNATGCDNPAEIANACGITLPCLPYGNYYFYTQSHIDNFPTNYPNCTILEGDVIIKGDDITNLNGLNVVASIGGDLLIGEDIHYSVNPLLSSLAGLDNLTSIGGYLEIAKNSALTSLSGLDNIEAESIEDIRIKDNPYLSHCSVLSICNYLSNPNGFIDIYNNKIGCDSPEEVLDSCYWVSVDDLYVTNNLFLYPNPTSTHITIELPHTLQKNTFLTLYNLNGQQLISQQITEPQIVVDISGLPRGVYFVKVVDDEKVMMGKAVKN